MKEAPILISLDFDKEFLIFSIAFEETIAIIFFWKNNECFEQPIAFFTRALRDLELKYNSMEKHDIGLVKDFKYFRIYIMYSKIIAYVTSNIFKIILNQPESEGK